MMLVTHSNYSVSQKKIPPPAACGFLKFFHKRLIILNHFYTPVTYSYLH